MPVVHLPEEILLAIIYELETQCTGTEFLLSLRLVNHQWNEVILQIIFTSPYNGVNSYLSGSAGYNAPLQVANILQQEEDVQLTRYSRVDRIIRYQLQSQIDTYQGQQSWETNFVRKLQRVPVRVNGHTYARTRPDAAAWHTICLYVQPVWRIFLCLKATMADLDRLLAMPAFESLKDTLRRDTRFSSSSSRYPFCDMSSAIVAHLVNLYLGRHWWNPHFLNSDPQKYYPVETDHLRTCCHLNRIQNLRSNRFVFRDRGPDFWLLLVIHAIGTPDLLIHVYQTRDHVRASGAQYLLSYLTMAAMCDNKAMISHLLRDRSSIRVIGEDVYLPLRAAMISCDLDTIGEIMDQIKSSLLERAVERAVGAITTGRPGVNHLSMIGRRKLAAICQILDDRGIHSSASLCALSLAAYHLGDIDLLRRITALPSAKDILLSFQQSHLGPKSFAICPSIHEDHFQCLLFLLQDGRPNPPETDSSESAVPPIYTSPHATNHRSALTLYAEATLKANRLDLFMLAYNTVPELKTIYSILPDYTHASGSLSLLQAASDSNWMCKGRETDLNSDKPDWIYSQRLQAIRNAVTSLRVENLRFLHDTKPIRNSTTSPDLPGVIGEETIFEEHLKIPWRVYKEHTDDFNQVQQFLRTASWLRRNSTETAALTVLY